MAVSTIVNEAKGILDRTAGAKNIEYLRNQPTDRRFENQNDSRDLLFFGWFHVAGSIRIYGTTRYVLACIPSVVLIRGRQTPVRCPIKGGTPCPIALCSVPCRREKGLWEEHLARFTGKEVNQKAMLGGRVCRIDEAEEPSDVLWENIDTSLFQRCVPLAGGTVYDTR